MYFAQTTEQDIYRVEHFLCTSIYYINMYTAAYITLLAVTINRS